MFYSDASSLVFHNFSHIMRIDFFSYSLPITRGQTHALSEIRHGML